jgi:hypothetical protein
MGDCASNAFIQNDFSFLPQLSLGRDIWEVCISCAEQKLKEMVYGVSHKTEPTSFQDAISGPVQRNGLK